MLKSQQRFRSEKQNVFTVEVNKFVLSQNKINRFNRNICRWNVQRLTM